jgi:aspartate/methionine/tyrosine aminotransferase
MKITPFKLERYFAKYEFTAKYLLSSSDCDGFTVNEILSLASEEEQLLWNNLSLGYTESQGLPSLRNEIVKLYTTISPQQLMVVTPEEGIFVALNCLLNKDDHVICIAPCYQSLHQIVESIGCEITYWLPNEEEGWYFDPSDIEKAIRSNTRLIIVNFPHNPTGYLPSVIDYQRIVDIARANSLYLFSDEMYRFLEHQSECRLPSASDLYHNAISLSGLSKTFGLAGLRLGWISTQNSKLLEDMMAFKDYTTICNSAPSEMLGLIGLRNKKYLIDRNLHQIKNNLNLLDDFMVRHNQILSWVKPKAATIGFARLNIAESSFDFCEEVVNKSGVMIVPSEMFDYGSKHIRLGFGRANFPTALAKFEEHLELNHRK